MRYYQNILETIGRTPLIRLNRIAQDVAPTVLAKVEFFNPGGSVKDRIGLSLVEACEQFLGVVRSTVVESKLELRLVAAAAEEAHQRAKHLAGPATKPPSPADQRRVDTSICSGVM